MATIGRRRDDAGSGSVRESDKREADQRSTRIIPGSTMLTSLVSSASRKKIPARVQQTAGLRGAFRALRQIKKLAKQNAAARESFPEEIHEADSTCKGCTAKIAAANRAAPASFNNVR